eukprot:SAG31_NODE_35363_length_324_cov_0.568889_1_plen_58_part_10
MNISYGVVHQNFSGALESDGIAEISCTVQYPGVWTLSLQVQLESDQSGYNGGVTVPPQ